jgi:uncharacterized SAM-binding protein YcdF (DUF218 family)
MREGRPSSTTASALWRPRCSPGAAARVVFSGGNGALVARVSTEALEARKLLADLGVDAVRVMMEDKFRSTDENARFTAALVHPEPPQRWLLVTSAYHMTRSTGVFEKAGFNVIPYPVAYRTAGSQYGLIWDFDPARNFRIFEVAAKEWIGLAAYWGDRTDGSSVSRTARRGGLSARAIRSQAGRRR